ncbi:hypothetical protein E2C01_003828 [Portunus trituberculatus]|uniref:Uncharacterized protein n=1 Tax=Portunus trituberculatus TaxID=210409 RepID=A0A5B7CNQ9_PORTR|nr:hypothetical protein [Portunus trituberculatus]
MAEKIRKTKSETNTNHSASPPRLVVMLVVVLVLMLVADEVQMQVMMVVTTAVCGGIRTYALTSAIDPTLTTLSIPRHRLPMTTKGERVKETQTLLTITAVKKLRLLRHDGGDDLGSILVSETTVSLPILPLPLSLGGMM